MPNRKLCLSRAVSMVETLEDRKLFADWGQIPKLIRQDDAATRFPAITGAGQSVAIIDTGIDYNMPYLGGGFGAGKKVVGGFDFVDNDADPMDTFGHGTNVAGIIAANEFEFEGAKYRGIAPGANLVALRVDSADQPVPATRIRSALQWVVDHQAEFNIVAVNISFGEGNYPGTHSSLYSTQLRTLANNGVFVSGASGNGGVQTPQGVQYPAADASVFAVGSIDETDRITEWSSRGPNLDIVAPGLNVVTTSAGPNNFEKVSGTSFSTPMISGAVALMKQANPDLHTFDLRSIFRNAGISNKDGDNELGNTTGLTFPRLDVTAAIALASAWKPGPLSNTGALAAATSSSLAYDEDGVLHAVYYDPKAQTLQYVVRLQNDKVSTPMRVDPAQAITGIYSSLQIDSQGRPGVAYFDGTHGDLRYAHFNGASWDVHTIEGLGSVGLYPSLVFDDKDNPIISYYHKTNGNLKLAKWAGTGWLKQNLDTKGNIGRSTSIARSSTGELAISYEHSTLGVLKVARDGGNGTWKLAQADAATGGIGFTSLAFNNQGQPAVAYYNARRSDLKYTTTDGTNWTPITLNKKGSTGLYPQLFFDRTNKANILFYNRRTDDLVRLIGDSTGWTSSVLQSTGGKFIALANNNGTGITYAYFRDSTGQLVLGDFSLNAPAIPGGG